MEEQQEADIITESEIVLGLTVALYSVTEELEKAAVENDILREQIISLEKEVSRLQNDLKQTDEALKRSQKKRRAQTRARIDLLYDLTKKDMEINNREEHWSSSCQLLEENLKQEKKMVEALESEAIILYRKLKENEDKWKEAAETIKPVSNQHQVRCLMITLLYHNVMFYHVFFSD